MRFIGFTGHKDPLAHLRTLEVAKEHGFKFDAVQMPLNVLDAHFRSFREQRAAGAGEGGNRRSRHEIHGRRISSGEQSRYGGRVPQLRAHAADLRGHHGMERWTG